MVTVKVRHVKIIKFTLRNRLNDVEKEVNKAIDELAAQGHKVVSIYTYQAGASPIYVVYNIIYE